MVYRRRNRKFEQWKADFLRDHQPKAEVSPSEIEITSLDQQLLDKAIALMEKNINDSDFTVEQLSVALGMTPTEYMKSNRNNVITRLRYNEISM